MENTGTNTTLKRQAGQCEHAKDLDWREPGPGQGSPRCVVVTRLEFLRICRALLFSSLPRCCNDTWLSSLDSRPNTKQHSQKQHKSGFASCQSAFHCIHSYMQDNIGRNNYLCSEHKHNTLTVQSYPEVGVGRELLSSVLGQALVQWDRVGEQNNEVLAVEASLACLSQALVVQSQGTREHLAAYWSAGKRNSHICRTILKNKKY